MVSYTQGANGCGCGVHALPPVPPYSELVLLGTNLIVELFKVGESSAASKTGCGLSDMIVSYIFILIFRLSSLKVKYVPVLLVVVLVLGEAALTSLAAMLD